MPAIVCKGLPVSSVITDDSELSSVSFMAPLMDGDLAIVLEGYILLTYPEELLGANDLQMMPFDVKLRVNNFRLFEAQMTGVLAAQ